MTTISEDQNAGAATPVMDLIASGMLAAIAVWAIVESLRLPLPGAVHTAPGLLPFLTAASLLVMALILGATALRRRTSIPHAADRIELPSDFRRTLVLGGIVILYVLGLEHLPVSAAANVAGLRLVVGAFEVSSVVVLTATLRLYWRQSLARCLLVAVGWITLLSITFRTLFHIQLP